MEAGLDIVTEQELDAIEARAKKASGWHNDIDALVESAEDIATLVAEVRRLRDQLAVLRRLLIRVGFVPIDAAEKS